MQNFYKTLLALAFVALVSFGISAFVSREYAERQPMQQATLGGGDGFRAYHCSMATSTNVTITNSASTQILATSSRRAWARVEQPLLAGNNVALAFNQGAGAVIGGGTQLTAATATTTRDYIEFGLNTDFPYTGAVTAISSVGATTVLVEECRYDN